MLLHSYFQAHLENIFKLFVKILITGEGFFRYLVPTIDQRYHPNHRQNMFVENFFKHNFNILIWQRINEYMHINNAVY